MGDQDERARHLALAERDDVLRRPPAEQPARGRRDAGGVEEGEDQREQDDGGAERGGIHRQHAADDREPGVDGISGGPPRPHREPLELNLPPELLEPLRKMLSSPPLGITAGRPRPELINERLGLGESVDARSLHAFSFRHAVLMPGVGFEPTRPFGQSVLSR